MKKSLLFILFLTLFTPISRADEFSQCENGENLRVLFGQMRKASKNKDVSENGNALLYVMQYWCPKGDALTKMQSEVKEVVTNGMINQIRNLEDTLEKVSEY